MKYVAGMLLLMLSGVPFLLLISLGALVQDEVLFGFAFVFLGPLGLLGVVLMHNSVGRPGRTAYLGYIATDLAFMSGAFLIGHQGPNIDWLTIRDGRLMIGSLVLSALLVGLLRVEKP